MVGCRFVWAEMFHTAGPHVNPSGHIGSKALHVYNWCVRPLFGAKVAI